MLAGHYSAAFLAKRLDPRVPLWTLLLAVQLVDVFWVVFVLAGVEHARLDPTLASNPLDLYDMPYTHSLLATACWALAAFLVARRFLGDAGRAGVVALAVASHWGLDLVVHRPDLSLWDGVMKMGFGLWNRPLVALALELGLLAGSIGLLVDAPGLPRTTVRGVLGLGTALTAVQLAVTFGPLPPTVTAMVLSVLPLYLLVTWAGARIERHAPPH
jgi:hypothetical protein